MLTYQRTNTLEVVGFSDSNYAGCVDDKKSTFGYIFIIVEEVVLLKSIKKTLIDSSTMEACMWRVIKLPVMHYGCGTLFHL